MSETLSTGLICVRHLHPQVKAVSADARAKQATAEAAAIKASAELSAAVHWTAEQSEQRRASAVAAAEAKLRTATSQLEKVYRGNRVTSVLGPGYSARDSEIDACLSISLTFHPTRNIHLQVKSEAERAAKVSEKAIATLQKTAQKRAEECEALTDQNMKMKALIKVSPTMSSSSLGQADKPLQHQQLGNHGRSTLFILNAMVEGTLGIFIQLWYKP